MQDQRQQALHIARTIRAFLDGSGGDWDWDDWTSCPICDPQLDRIRLQAEAVPLPTGDEGRIALQMLAAEAEKMANG